MLRHENVPLKHYTFPHTLKNNEREHYLDNPCTTATRLIRKPTNTTLHSSPPDQIYHQLSVFTIHHRIKPSLSYLSYSVTLSSLSLVCATKNVLSKADNTNLSPPCLVQWVCQSTAVLAKTQDTVMLSQCTNSHRMIPVLS